MPSWDTLTGFATAAGLLGAELHRRATGEGQLITVSLADVALSIASSLGYLAEAELLSEDRMRYGNHVFGAFGRDFRTSDGATVMVVALTPRQWQSLLEATGTRGAMDAIARRSSLDLDDEGDRFSARDEIAAVLEPWFATHSITQVADLFQTHNVLWGPYRTFKELVRHERARSPMNPMLDVVDQPGIGSYLRSGSPLRFGAVAPVPAAPAPAMGADTRDVLRSWLGMTDERIADLARANVIAAE
jgi:2-methylfumaryl-CoA isomerase